jgi:dynein heavy chain 2, cytosolic
MLLFLSNFFFCVGIRFLTAGAKEEIIHFNADKVSKEHLRLTQALVEKNKSSFEEETAKRASVAAAPLAAWVKACVKYAEVYEKIAPLAAEKRKLERCNSFFEI